MIVDFHYAQNRVWKERRKGKLGLSQWDYLKQWSFVERPIFACSLMTNALFFVLDHSPRPCCSERLDWGTGNMQSNRLWNGQRREPGKHLRKENKGSCYIQLLLYQFLKSFVSLYLSSVFTICISIFWLSRADFQLSGLLMRHSCLDDTPQKVMCE